MTRPNPQRTHPATIPRAPTAELHDAEQLRFHPAGLPANGTAGLLVRSDSSRVVVLPDPPALDGAVDRWWDYFDLSTLMNAAPATWVEAIAGGYK